MAENKKSFLLYSDQIHTIKKMVEKDRLNKTNNAGELFLHILEYVNDLSPIPVNDVVDLTFEPIKQQLKRDLKSWEETSQTRSDIGRTGGIKSGEARRRTKQNEAIASNLKQNEHDTVNVNDTVNDTKKIPLLERKTDFNTKAKELILTEDNTELIKFIEYWTESSENGKKMRFEMQKVFDFKKRFSTWMSNKKKWNFEKETGMKIITTAKTIE